MGCCESDFEQPESERKKARISQLMAKQLKKTTPRIRDEDGNYQSSESSDGQEFNIWVSDQYSVLKDDQIWEHVNALWAQHKLDKDQGLTKEIAIEYIKNYYRNYIQKTSTDKIDFEAVFDSIDRSKNGLIEREELFTHLKKTIHPDQYEFEMTIKAMARRK